MAHELDTRLNRRVSAALYVDGNDWDDDDDELLALEEELESQDMEDWKPNGFVRFVERFPYIVILCVLGVTAVCGTLLYFYAPVPDFFLGEDPTRGFETRGTPIHSRAWTLRLLNDHRGKDYDLMPNRTIIADEFNRPSADVMEDYLDPDRGSHGNHPTSRHSEETLRVTTPATSDKTFSRSNQTDSHGRRVKRRSRSYYVRKNGECPTLYLQDAMSFKFVIEPRDPGADLLNVDLLLAQCQLEEELIGPFVADRNAVVSLPRIILCLRNKKYKKRGCKTMEEQDVLHFRMMLYQCAPYYYNETLARTSLSRPEVCANHSDLLDHFFYNMVPVDFYNPSNTADKTTHRLSSVLTYTSYGDMRSPFGDKVPLNGKDVYIYGFEGRKTENDKVKLSAMKVLQQMDAKYDLFSEYLMYDVEVYFTLALALILLIMILYTRSFALMVATILNVIISFILACAVYFFICRLNFFPFINLLAGLVLIAVGADDVFIFYDTWKQIRQESPNLTMAQTLSRTYAHAAVSIFVTSLTTGAAFFSNVFSTSITCIRCFGIFAGIAILVNFLVMVMWTPAVVICVEKLWAKFLQLKCWKSKCWNCYENCCLWFNNVSNVLFSTIFPRIIIRAWFFWIFLYLGLGIGASIIVFVTPKLQLPKSKDFQLFPSSNLLENWDLNYASKFPFEMTETIQDKIPLYFIFGFHAEDNGNKLDPEVLGEVAHEDKNFNIYTNETQLWLIDFCRSLKNQSFLDYHYQNQGCALEKFGQVFKEYCDNPLYRKPIHKCCDNYEAPYSEYQLQYCVPGLQVITGRNLGLMGEPIYRPDNHIAGLMMFVYTNLNFSLSYDEMDVNYKTVQSFMDNALKNAPLGLQSGFVSAKYEFTFYDLQGAIAKGTYLSIVMSLSIAFLIMFLTSMNLLITVYAIVTIAGAIICTVACIVLMGWELNIIESITISLAVGLSIDFTIHYGVAYRLAKSTDSVGRVKESFSRVGSAVAMAALTTFAAGAAMMPSHVIAYTKLGIFLMLVMTFSWLYATFFFQSVCRIMGPSGDFCQIKLPCMTSTKTADGNRATQAPGEDDAFLVTF